MKPKTMYLVLCVLGLALPYWQFLPWLAAHGLDWRLFLHELSANRISSFFVMDVLVSAVTLFVFIGSEQKRLGGKGWWLPRACVLLVGVSLGLPLFLYMREKAMQPGGERQKAGQGRIETARR